MTWEDCYSCFTPNCPSPLSPHSNVSFDKYVAERSPQNWLSCLHLLTMAYIIYYLKRSSLVIYHRRHGLLHAMLFLPLPQCVHKVLLKQFGRALSFSFFFYFSCVDWITSSFITLPVTSWRNVFTSLSLFHTHTHTLSLFHSRLFLLFLHWGYKLDFNKFNS